jgi:hypothetical protein
VTILCQRVWRLKNELLEVLIDRVGWGRVGSGRIGSRPAGCTFSVETVRNVTYCLSVDCGMAADILMTCLPECLHNKTRKR